MDEEQVRRRGEFMQALTTEHSALQSARSATISESASRSGLYLTTLSSAVVVMALVVQVSRMGQAFFVFAFAILPVVFFLGLVTFGRLLQSGVEDVIYARAISRIRSFYSAIEPSRADYFADTSVDQVGLTAMGLFKLRWQQFLAAAAAIAVVQCRGRRGLRRPRGQGVIRACGRSLSHAHWRSRGPAARLRFSPISVASVDARRCRPSIGRESERRGPTNSRPAALSPACRP